METYVVLSSVGQKPVSVRIGTAASSEYKQFSQGQEFKTSPEFAANLLELGYVEKVAVKPAAEQANKKGETK